MEFIISVEHQLGTCLLICLFSMSLFFSRSKSTYFVFHNLIYLLQQYFKITLIIKLLLLIIQKYFTLKSEVGADVFGVIY